MAKRTISIKLYMSELVYDVENKTWQTGEVRRGDGTHKQASAMQMNNDDDRKNQLMRSIGNAWERLLMHLSEWVSSEDNTVYDSQIGNVEFLEVLMHMPMNYNRAMNGAIATAMHQYIVNLSISDWYMLVSKDDAADYMELAAANLEQLKSAINKRVRPVRG